MAWREKSPPPGMPLRAIIRISFAIVASVRFSLHCSAGIVGLPIPFFDAARRMHPRARTACARWLLPVLRGVRMVAQHLFRKRDVDLSFVFLQQFIPARSPGFGELSLLAGSNVACLPLSTFGSRASSIPTSTPSFVSTACALSTQVRVARFRGLPVAEQPVRLRIPRCFRPA